MVGNVSSKEKLLYEKLIKTKKYFFIAILMIPIFIGYISRLIGEDDVFIVIIFYFILFFCAILKLYFFSQCPRCGGLFYGPRFEKNNIVGVHKFF
jgi:hypothetical protein